MARSREELEVEVSAFCAQKEQESIATGAEKKLEISGHQLLQFMHRFGNDGAVNAADDILEFLKYEGLGHTNYDLDGLYQYCCDWDGSDDEGYPFDCGLIRFADGLWVIVSYLWSHDGGRLCCDGHRVYVFSSEVAARAAFAGFRQVNTVWRLCNLEVEPTEDDAAA